MTSPGRRDTAGYLPTLDGWRTIAILLVIGSHDQLHRIAGVPLTWLHFRAGEYGVALFFALSGLLICSRLLQEEVTRNRIDLKAFYIRRIFRIQPAALVYLAFICVLIAFGAISRTDNGVLSALLSARNYLGGSYKGDAWYTTHFWSLAVEEHFYLFLPALLVVIRRYRLPVFLALFVLVEAVHLGLSWLYWLPNPHTDLQGAIILLGALAAILLTHNSFRELCVRLLQPWLVLSVVLLLWIRLATHNGRFNYLIFILTLPLLLLSTMLHPASLASRVLETPPFQFIGRISYSLYLWQQLFFLRYQVAPTGPASNPLSLLQHTWLRYCALPAVAIASYYWVERPLIRLGHRLAAPATPGRADLAAAVSLPVYSSSLIRRKHATIKLDATQHATVAGITVP